MAKLTWLNIWITVFMSLGGYTYGFSIGVFVSTIGQASFYTYFELDPGSQRTSAILGAVNAIVAAGAAFGALTQGWTADYFGRKKAVFIASTCAAIGGALIAGSVHVGMLITARFINGLGIGQLLTLSPLYITEVAPASRRGTLLTIFSVGIGFGVCFSTWINVGTYFASDPAIQWRVPLALACLAPVIMMFGVWFVPESPRWLIWQGHNDQAWTIIQSLHSDNTDAHDAAAHAEYVQIVRQVEIDKRVDASYWKLFTVPSWRKRLLTVSLLFFAAQSTGVYGIGAYLAVICQNLGMTGVVPLVLVASFNSTGGLIQAVAAFFIDRIGRKTMFLIGFPITTVALLGEALLQRQYLGTSSQGGNRAAVAFLFLFTIGFNVFIDPTSFVYTSELWPTPIRSKGIAMAWVVYFLGYVTYTAPAGLAFQNIGWRMYMVWFSCNIVSIICIYFFLPESANKTLEEMGDLFGDEVAVHIAGDGVHFVETSETDDGCGNLGQNDSKVLETTDVEHREGKV